MWLDGPWQRNDSFGDAAGVVNIGSERLSQKLNSFVARLDGAPV